MIESMKREDNTMYMKKADRGKWADGLDLTDINQAGAEVLFHAGCRYAYDDDLRSIIRGQAMLLKNAGVDIGIAGKDEACCGGRAFEIGYQGEMKNYAEDMASRVKASGAHTLVTPCSDCYYTFKYLYPKNGLDLGVKILHTTEYVDLLIKSGRMRPAVEVPLAVTYHDPCHLGRRGEIYKTGWFGTNKLERPIRFKQTGKMGIFDPPRDIIKAIPGIDFREMERIREYSWCCGAGGGVLESEPDFAAWTARERLEEARATGAHVLVTACPWCERVFKDALAETGDASLRVMDVMELVMLSQGGTSYGVE
jgi:Fe-S oxidoreductase